MDNIFHQLQEALELEDARKTQKCIEFLDDGLADAITSLSPKDRLTIWGSLTSAQKTKVLPLLNSDLSKFFIENSEDINEIQSAMQDLESDDLTDIVQNLSDEAKEVVLSGLDDEQRDEIEELLSFPEDTAGGLMSKDYMTLRSDITVGVALRYLRKKHDEVADNITHLMVVDRDDFYEGMVSLRNLLVTDEEVLLEKVTNKEYKAIDAFTHEKEVAEIFEKIDLISVAVVNAKGLLIGQITIDDVVDVIKEDVGNQMFVSAGLGKNDDVFAPIKTSLPARSIWLGINLITAILAALVITLYEDTIEKVVALAVLMPIIASMGGIAATQTSTLIIRFLSTSSNLSKSLFKLIVHKEFLIGLFNGILWSSVTTALVWLWFSSIELALIFGLAMVSQLIIAATFGAIIPMFLSRIGTDPAISASIIITTVTDIFGFFILLGFGSWFLI